MEKLEYSIYCRLYVYTLDASLIYCGLEWGVSKWKKYGFIFSYCLKACSRYKEAQTTVIVHLILIKHRW